QLRNPSVTITPLRRIYVLGEVAKPGLYTVDPTISLAGAVAIAGGATASGDLDRLRVVRNGKVVLDRAAAGSSLSAINIRSEDQVFVDRRGWLDRNSALAASAVLSAATLVATLLLR
ncbi:MAG: SLBB domain-containing protein, partial [Gemmatimonadaceae bacterium]